MAQLIPAFIALAGAGYSAYSSYQQGKTADAFAKYNAHQQQLNAKMQLMSVQAQAMMQKRMAEAQFRLRQGEADARFANARSIEVTAEAQSRSVRESIRRKAGEFERHQGTQRAMIAKSGVVESSGTPLDILAETAATIQLEREDALHADELNRRTLFREADLERLGGRLALAGATLEKNSAVAEAGLRSAAGQAQYRSGVREAEITRLTGAAQRQAYTGQAWGTLLSGVGSAAGDYATYKPAPTTTTAKSWAGVKAR
jgi:hypothetical protein